ncbi:B12-binding domain-containing protein [Paenibacillus rhizoplanae]
MRRWFIRCWCLFLVKVGDAWEQGKATVAQEHYMTHMISNRLSQFFTCSRCMPIYKR